MSTKPMRYTISINDDETILDLYGKIIGSVCRSPSYVEIWAEYDMDADPQPRAFRVVSTGHSVPLGFSCLSTVIGPEIYGSKVWHIYEMEANFGGSNSGRGE